jgi:hypothetical protein
MGFPTGGAMLPIELAPLVFLDEVDTRGRVGASDVVDEEASIGEK